MAAHVNLQGAGTGAALLALGKGADALVGVGILGLFVQGGRGGVLAAGTVVHQVSLQVPLAPVPDAAVLAGKDVLWKAEEDQRRGGESLLQPENHEGRGFGAGERLAKPS